MARYLVLLKFNSQQNAYNFVQNPYNSTVLGATEADVTSGYIGPSGPSTGIGQPSSAPSSGYGYVDIYVSSPNQIPTGYYNGPNKPSATQLILDLSTRVPIYVSPNIDPNSITLKEGDNTILQDGIPAPDWTPPDSTLDSPIEFKPIYYPGQDPNEFYREYLKLVSEQLQPDIPFTPDSPIEQQDLPPIQFPLPMLDDQSPFPPPSQIEPFSPYTQEWPEIEIPPSMPLTPDQMVPDFFPYQNQLDPQLEITPPSGQQGETPGIVPPEFKPARAQPISVEGPSAGGGSRGGVRFVAGTHTNYYYSLDGINWNVANIASSITSLGPNFTETDYLQGMFASQFSYTSGFGWMVSSDGINWQLACITTDNSAIVLTFSGNNFVFSSGGAGPFPKTVFNPNPASPVLLANDMDATGDDALADPSQVLGASTIPAIQVLKNSLSSANGMTAIRRGHTGTPFQYTTTRITDAIVAGGVTWPGATWVTPASWSIVVGGADIFYAAVGTTAVSV